MGTDKSTMPDPIFDIGKVPSLPHCVIHKREYRTDAKWHYAIINNYNSYGSGWADEDWIIAQIAKQRNYESRFKPTP